MKKFVVLIVFFALFLSLSACIEIDEVTSIELDWTPKERYELNETVDLSELDIIAHLQDGSERTVNILTDGVEVTQGLQEGSDRLLDTSIIGEYTLRITYEGFVLEFDYTVYNPNVWDGQVTDKPSYDEVEDRYTITKASEWVWLSNTRYDSWTTGGYDEWFSSDIYLANDIDFGGHYFYGLEYARDFVFDGNGKTIYGLNYPLYNYLYDNIVFKDFVIEIDKEDTDGTFGALSRHVGIHSWASEMGKISDQINYNALLKEPLSTVATDFDDLNQYTVGDLANIDVLVENVDLRGDILFSGQFVGGYFSMVGSGAPNDNDEALDVVFKNCNTSDLEISSTDAAASLFVGKMWNGTLYFDDSTINHLGKVNLASAARGNLFLGAGDSTGSSLHDIQFQGFTSADTEFTSVNTIKTDESYGYNEILVHEENTLESMALGEHLVFSKSNANVTRLIITFRYIVGQGYRRYIIKNMNVASIDETVSVVLPIQKMYVTQDPEKQDEPFYVYNNESNNPLRTEYGYRIIITELDDNGDIVIVTNYDYPHPDSD